MFDLLTSKPLIRYYLSKSFHGPVDGGYESHAWLTAHQPGARYAPAAFLEGTLFDRDIASVYATVAAPALVVYGDDPYSSQAHLPELVTKPGWQAHRLASAGLPHFEMLVETADLVGTFIEETDQAEGPSSS
jgi:hypothetical protein